MVAEESASAGGETTTKSESGREGGDANNNYGSVSGGGDGKVYGQTYKRRKYGSSSSETTRSSELSGKLSSASGVPGEDKMVKKFGEIRLGNAHKQGYDPQMNENSVLNHSSDEYWRKRLEMLCESLSSDSVGIQGGVRDVHVYDRHAASNSVTESESMPNASVSAAEGPAMVTSNGSSSEFNHHIITQQCQRTLSRLILSQKFASLCKLLSENLHGVNVDKVLDLSMIVSRMKGGAYEQNPALFSYDIQQFWRKLNVVGNEMVSLAKSLSELSRLFCREPAGGSEHDTSTDKKEALDVDSDGHTRPEQADASVTSGICGCCKLKTNGRDSLVCDSCEESYHVSCIEPAVKEIPHKSWYCSKCTRLGVQVLHEDCVVCERLDSTSHGTNEDGYDIDHDEESDQLQQSQCIGEKRFRVFKGNQKAWCNVCKNALINNEVYRTCEHRFCQKHYHLRCLTDKQYKKYSSHWYGPCCLCRVCLVDRDDNNIVLCDACDHAYHIYCLNPPLAAIPTGKWFCLKCAAGIQAIKEARRLYENLGRKQKKTGADGRRACSSLGKQKMPVRSGGVDMLLTAANTLNYQEELVARYSKVRS
ncbi:PHD finger protein EHD3-like protein [Drosera capensis]